MDKPYDHVKAHFGMVRWRQHARSCYIACLNIPHIQKKMFRDHMILISQTVETLLFPTIRSSGGYGEEGHMIKHNMLITVGGCKANLIENSTMKGTLSA